MTEAIEAPAMLNSEISSVQRQVAVPLCVAVSVLLIGPEPCRCDQLKRVLDKLECGTIAEISAYPELNQLTKIISQNYEVILIDLDTNPDYALDLVEGLCGQSASTVMVFSTQAEAAWMVRCMRAGAREFLEMPPTASSVSEALVRAAARQSHKRNEMSTQGGVSVFFGSKGGCGVTTLACNFALLLARESSRKTLLIDLDLPLGDAALALGITAKYSTADALNNFARLDSTLLSKLLVQHGSYFSVLAAPSVISKVEATRTAVNKLLTVARQEFDFIVIDAGARLGAHAMATFDIDAKYYLVSQVGIPDLRNANRIISEFFPASVGKLDIVLNRYSASSLGLDDDHIRMALTRPAQWKIPEDCTNARKTQNTGTPLGLADSDVSKVVLQMACACAGVAVKVKKKKWLSTLRGQ